ncbi:uncharacterized protein NPIL_186301 [Nephila pilipes]|uniref:CUB domain-containing protein n=1 Tax=Nephila pilipes TaxID=299642 RepID=A0A8X6MNK4_NEPPI|nr:uncharacterized protein NPIL_186301 [Nephila pilipes]
MANKIRNFNFFNIWVFISVIVVYDAEATLRTTFVEDLCYNKKSALFDLRYQPTGILMSTPRSVTDEPFDCEIILMPPKQNSIVLSIYRYDINSNDLLTIEDSDHHTIGLMGWGSFRDEKKAIISDGKIVIRYKTMKNSKTHPRQGFQFTFTTVTNSPCFDNEFKCNNGRCVLKEYVCDGHNHCGDNSDQKKCAPTDDHRVIADERIIEPPGIERTRLRAVWITIIGVVGLILLIVIIVVVVIVVRRSKANKSKTEAVSPTNANNPATGGSIPLQSVSPTVPQEAPTVPTAPPAPEHEGFSFYNRVRRSLRGLKNSNVEEEPKQEERSEIYQVPSMYPSLDHTVHISASEGVENPEFKIEE